MPFREVEFTRSDLNSLGSLFQILYDLNRSRPAEPMAWDLIQLFRHILETEWASPGAPSAIKECKITNPLWPGGKCCKWAFGMAAIINLIMPFCGFPGVNQRREYPATSGQLQLVR